jgi:hypothetical protein
MQCDAISSTLNALTGALSVITFLAAIFYILTYIAKTECEDMKPLNVAGRRILCVAGSIFLTLALLAAVVPDTKTAAAMYVVPSVLTTDNVDTLKKDFGDIYNLAVEGAKDKLGK